MYDNTLDILFVSNFSKNLDETENNIAIHLPSNIKYKILTYRKTDIKNSFSYEEFIVKNYDEIEKFDIKELNSEYENVNLYLSVVSERFFTNYYFGIENTLGNKSLSYDEINFLVKSFALFLSPYIKETKLVFSGYADNFISTMTYNISEQFNRRCIAFHEVSLIDNDSNYLFEGLFGKPVEDLIIHEKLKTFDELISFMKNYDGAKDRKDRAKKNVGMKKGIFGVFSPNILDMKYIKFALFGYSTKPNIFKYMNIDRPDILKKLTANFSRVYNKILAIIFFKTLKFEYKSNIVYIYFPLQIQPEASTASRSPFYMNQLSTIENISKSLPLGHKLLVKEHPLAVGMNSIKFYKKIVSIPNVELVDISIKGTYMIDISDLMITFGGTTLFESILNGKKVLILLKDYMYTQSDMIFKAFGKTDIKKEIKNALNTNFSEEEIEIEKEKMLNYFYRRGFPRFKDFEKNIAKNLIKVYYSDAKI